MEKRYSPPITGEEPPLKTKREKIAEMILAALAKNVLVRAFDVRYATAGIPELGQDYLYYPEGSGGHGNRAAGWPLAEYPEVTLRETGAAGSIASGGAMPTQ